MKTGTYRSIILAILFIIAFPLSGQVLPDKISQAIRAGDAKGFSLFFNDNIELVILDKEDIYSRQQAEMIVRDFFSTHKPTGFKLLHQGGKQATQYAIGSLATSNGNFRIYFLMKYIDNKPFIHQLRITAENE